MLANVDAEAGSVRPFWCSDCGTLIAPRHAVPTESKRYLYRDGKPAGEVEGVTIKAFAIRLVSVAIETDPQLLHPCSDVHRVRIEVKAEAVSVDDGLPTLLVRGIEATTRDPLQHLVFEALADLVMHEVCECVRHNGEFIQKPHHD